MTISEMRLALLKEYPRSGTWCYKCWHMPDRQVAAIYNKFLAEGRFNPKPKEIKVNNGPKYIQPDFFELLK